jgi:hypothetical protein
MDQQKKSAMRTAVIMGCVALFIYVGFYFLMASR